MLRVVWLASLVLALMAAPALASQWYRYENDEGVMVMSQSIPPEHVHRGYEVLDSTGRVIRVVEREPTDAEIAERERARQREEEAEARRRERRERDEELLMRYASAEEVEHALERELQAAERHIRASEANVERLRNHKREQEREAARRERAGNSPPETLLKNIGITEMQIAEHEREIAERRKEKERLRAKFERDYERVRELYSRLGSSG